MRFFSPKMLVAAALGFTIAAGLSSEALAMTTKPFARICRDHAFAAHPLCSHGLVGAATTQQPATTGLREDLLNKFRNIVGSSSSRSSVSSRSSQSSAPAQPNSNDLQRVFQLVNQERANAGLPAYTYNTTLEKSAKQYAYDMHTQNFFSHVSPSGETLTDRMQKSGYIQPGRGYSVGENIAMGQKTPEQVMHDWMNSPPHREAILSTTYKEIGVGRDGNYWVQHFGVIR
jgi:uncharacterized protein YkwD